MKKVLILQLRPEEIPAQNEYEAFLASGGLKEEEVERRQLTKTPLTIDLNLNDYSAILLGGGPQNISDPEHKKSDEQKKLERSLFDLLDRVYEKDFPFLGVCLGIGLLVSHQKGILSLKYGEKINAVDISLTQEGKKDPVLQGVCDPFRAFVGHKEACEVLPKGSVSLAGSAACPVQMFRVKENIYALQFHPELDREGVEVRVKAYDNMGYFQAGEGPSIIRMAKKESTKDAKKILANFIDKYHNSQKQI